MFSLLFLWQSKQMYQQLSLKENSLQLRNSQSETREGETQTSACIYDKKSSVLKVNFSSLCDMVLKPLNIFL